jgi:tetratricopeptide (TPR) repeat protein
MQVPMLAPQIAALIDEGRFAEATAMLERADQIVRQEDYGQSNFLDVVRINLLAATDRADQALDEFRRMRLARSAKDPEPGPDDRSSQLQMAANLHLAAGDAAAAARSARMLLEKIERSPNAVYLRPEAARANLVLGQALSMTGQLREARPYLDQAVTLYRTVVDPEVGLPLADALVMLARAESASGAKDAAARLRAEAARIRAHHPQVGPQHPAS